MKVFPFSDPHVAPPDGVQMEDGADVAGIALNQLPPGQPWPPGSAHDESLGEVLAAADRRAWWHVPLLSARCGEGTDGAMMMMKRPACDSEFCHTRVWPRGVSRQIPAVDDLAVWYRQLTGW